MKPGWVAHPGLGNVLIGHKPRVLRTPAPKHPSRIIRATWVFRDGEWSKIEDKINIEELDVRAAKLEAYTVMSITIFERSPESEEEIPDSDREADPRTPEERLRAEAKSVQHLMTHRPKNPYCPVCQRAKMMAPHARKLGGSSTIKSEKYGDHLTIDHIITRDLRDYGFDDQKVGFVVKDVCTKFRYVYPDATKEGEQCYENLLHFTGADDEIGVIYSDNAPELEYAVKKLGVRHNTSREYSDENKAVIEREIRTVLEGTRAALTQAGLPDKMWPLAAQHHCIALNINSRVDCDASPWESRFGAIFDGPQISFGAKVLFWNNPKQNAVEASKFAPTGQEGIFLGYHIQPGFVFKREYLVTPVKDALDNIENGTFKTIRVKRMELLPGDFTFPCQQEQLDFDDARRVPTLDDQNCFAQEQPETIDFFEDLKGTELYEELMAPIRETEELQSKMSSEEFQRLLDEAAAGRELRDEGEDSGREEDKRPPEASSSSKAKPPIPMHDPTRLPSGKPVPKGYNWDGVRLVRNKKGSKRPPDTPSEFWHMYSPKQREEDIARYQRKLELEEERKRKEAEAESPAMPVIHNSPKEPHRERLFHLYWNKLSEVADQQLALVARLVSQAEVDRTPDAKAAMDKEWKKLADKACWLEIQGCG